MGFSTGRDNYQEIQEFLVESVLKLLNENGLHIVGYPKGCDNYQEAKYENAEREVVSCLCT
jgi:hypothetical protein